MNKYHTFKKQLHVLHRAFTHAQQNGWQPVEAPWLPDGVTWDLVDVIEEQELFVHCTAHKRFHTITSWYKREDGYVRYFLFQPGFASALGYTLSDLEAWCDRGNDPVQYVAQCIQA
jgi:hypothetical protein